MFHVILFQPEIPPNTGNVIRLCANAGATLPKPAARTRASVRAIARSKIGMNSSDTGLIYFDEVAQKSTIERFWDAMASRSFLFIGHSESLFGMNTRFEFVKTEPNGEEYVYHTIKLVNATVSEMRNYNLADAKADKKEAKAEAKADKKEAKAEMKADKKEFHAKFDEMRNNPKLDINLRGMTFLNNATVDGPGADCGRIDLSTANNGPLSCNAGISRATASLRSRSVGSV